MADSKTLISVVVLNYNGLPYLKRALPPLLGLRYPNYEIVVIDNGSSDASREYLRSLDGIRIIENQDNLGYSKGKNRGVMEAKGEYVLLLDEDILPNNKNILDELMIEYDRLEQIGFLSVLLAQEGEDETTLYGGFMHFAGFYSNKKIYLKTILGRKSFESAGPDGGAVFFKKDVFVKLGGYDETQPYYIDVGDLGLRACIMGYKNYVYCKDHFVHLGKQRKTDVRMWCWKYQYCFSGLARIMVKNYTLKNLFIQFPFLCLYFIIKTIKQLLGQKNFCVLRSFSYSIALFAKNLPVTLIERQKIRFNRIVKDDVFLKIRPPKF